PGVVAGTVRIIDADAERDGVPRRAQRLDLVQALQHGIGAVRQHEARPALGRVSEDVDDGLDDERLAARERELLDAKLDGLVDERLDVVEPDAVEPPVARLRALETERAGEITGRAGVKPQLPHRVRIDVSARFPGGGKAKRIEAGVHAPMLPPASDRPYAPARRSGDAPHA